MLLGGIGTGSISVGSRGQFTDFELFNQPSKGLRFPYTFFAINVKGNDVDFTKILESKLTPPYASANGLPAQQLGGLPRFHNSEMQVKFPFANIKFIDDSLPIKVEMEAFNPFIPLNTDDSSIPGAIISYRVKNISKQSLKISIAGSLYNASGYKDHNVHSIFQNIGHPFNKYKKINDINGILFDNDDLNKNSIEYGNMALVTLDNSISYKEEWQMGQRIDGAHNFWDDFSDDGKLENIPVFMGMDSKHDKKILMKVGSLAINHSLESEEEKLFTFVISWFFPNRIKNWPNTETSCCEKCINTTKNYYAVKFNNSWDAATYLLKNIKYLEETSKKFTNSVYNSTLPPYVIDAITANLFILKSTTCFRIENGNMYGFEGCCDSVGCCAGNCTHVWYYAQAMAYLFPELEQSMRRTDFLIETNDDGEMQFRAMRELDGKSWGFLPAVDGQMGTIARVYREWLISGNDSFLKELWPKVKLALDYGIKTWDTDNDFVLDGMKHVDYDLEFHGVDPLGNICYLVALKASIKMAEYLKDNDTKRRYEDIYSKASRKADEIMWNEKGGYYIQVLENVDTYKHQHGSGCLADQLIGQFYAHLLGLGYLMDPEHIKKATQSIFRYNFKNDFFNHHSVQRVYACNDDKGLLMTTWPLGGRPKFPFFYSDEVWGRTEYHVASTLIYEGFIDEGLTVAKAVRERYDGIKRNPWNEFECGWHYSGIMSSWALLLALSGFRPNLPNGKMYFSPVINKDNFKCFWSNGKAWGTYSQVIKDGKTEYSIETLYGDISDIEVIIE